MLSDLYSHEVEVVSEEQQLSQETGKNLTFNKAGMDPACSETNRVLVVFRCGGGSESEPVLERR